MEYKKQKKICFHDDEMNFENTADYDKLNAKIDSDVKLIESFKQN